MAVKTITIRERAYEALKAMKEPRESFSDTILRVSGKKSLMEFAGILSKESAGRLEAAIKENRKSHSEEYEKRVKRIAKALSG